VSPHRGASYPQPFDAPCAERIKRRLGDVFGLHDFGVNLVALPPGAWSSQRHWHSHEDEFIYVLEGRPSLITDEGETTLEAGSIAGFPKGRENGHHLVNNSGSTAYVLEVGSRRAQDSCHYSEADLALVERGKPGSRFTRKDGTPFEA